MLVLIEGAGFASALSLFLEEFKGFQRIVYMGDIKLSRHLTDNADKFDSRKVVIERLHLTAIANRKCSQVAFIQVDMALLEWDTRLILAVGNNESASHLIDGYSQSLLRKIVYHESQPISELVKWLGIPNDVRKSTPA